MTSPKLYGFHQLSYDDDIECYLSTFERLCISQKIPSDHWAVTFEAYLTGKAQKTFHLLTDADKQCFVAIKKAILFTYKLTPEAYCEKFRSAYKQSSETFHDFANRLRLYLRVVADQMISSLNDENLRLRFRETKWTKHSDLAGSADNLMVARMSTKTPAEISSSSSSTTAFYL